MKLYKSHTCELALARQEELIKEIHLPELIEWGVCNEGERMEERGFASGRREKISATQTGSSRYSQGELRVYH